MTLTTSVALRRPIFWASSPAKRSRPKKRPASCSDQHDERAVRREMLFEPGSPALSGGEAVSVEESVGGRLF
jgi:hypothetical protein